MTETATKANDATTRVNKKANLTRTERDWTAVSGDVMEQVIEIPIGILREVRKGVVGIIDVVGDRDDRKSAVS